MFGKRTSFIGIDIGSRFIKAVQVERRRSTTRVRSVLSLPRSAEDVTVDSQTINRLAGALARQGFVGRKVAFTCPAEGLLSDVLELPAANANVPVDRIAESEMRRLGRIAEPNFEMAYWPLPATARGAGGGTSVMAIAATESVTEPIAQLFENAGFDPVAVDGHACAIARACRPITTGGIGVVAELGASSASIVLACDGTVVYHRGVPEAGLASLQKNVCDALDLDDSEAECVLCEMGVLTAGAGLPPKQMRLRTLLLQYLDIVAAEIQSSIAFASHRYPSLSVTRVAIAGGGARLPNLASELSDRLRQRVEPVTFANLGLECVSLGEHAENPQLIAALGVAMNAAE